MHAATLFKPELLVPAGDVEKFHTAVLYGADAVYLGGRSGNLRASSKGLTDSELREAVTFAEKNNVKIFFCLNSLPFERDMKAVPSVVAMAAEAGAHAFIVADPGVLRVVQRTAPHVPVHVSTQANTTNAEAVKFWTEQGAERVNLARELSCAEIGAIRKALPETELEVFIHGAMCLAVSGQCLLSAWLNNRPANQGRCTQPCRFEYKTVGVDMPSALELKESMRGDDKLWRVEQDERYASFFAPDDLCLLPFLPWFVKNAITALKVEGRMKGASYVAHVTDTLRAALDAAHGSVASGGRFDWQRFLPDLAATATRPLSTGFFLPRRKALAPGIGNARPIVARVKEPIDAAKGIWAVDVRGKWEAARQAELMLPGMRRPILEPGKYSLENHRGEAAGIVNSGTQAVLHAENADILPGIFIRGV